MLLLPKQNYCAERFCFRHPSEDCTPRRSVEEIAEDFILHEVADELNAAGAENPALLLPLTVPQSLTGSLSERREKPLGRARKR